MSASGFSSAQSGSDLRQLLPVYIQDAVLAGIGIPFGQCEAAAAHLDAGDAQRVDTAAGIEILRIR